MLSDFHAVEIWFYFRAYLCCLYLICSRFPPHYAPSLFFLSLSYYLTNITTTSREMMVIGHFGLGQLLTWKRKWLQLGVLGSNLFNSLPPNNQNTSFPLHILCTLIRHGWINECVPRLMCKTRMGQIHTLLFISDFTSSLVIGSARDRRMSPIQILKSLLSRLLRPLSKDDVLESSTWL